MELFSRWEPSKQAIESITRQFQAVVAFGLEIFPGEATEVDPIQLLLGGAMCGRGIKLDVPIALHNAAAISTALAGVTPTGHTPTGEALRAALKTLGDRRPAVGRKAGYVLLVTDGDPTCDPTAVLNGGYDATAREAAKAAVRALEEKNIPTYVLGYEIDPMFQPFMHELAGLGGTGSYHPVENAEQLADALRKISEGVIGCSFELETEPSDAIDLRVVLDGSDVGSDAQDGWSVAGTTVTLHGSACAKLKDGAAHALEFQPTCGPAEGP
jgi:hypothetical protein